MLNVTNLQAYYGKSHVLHGVDLNVQQGEIVSLLGRNGVGRSTTAKAIIGLVECTGTITFKDQDLTQLPTHRIAHLGIGYVPENRDIFPTLTVEENLALGLKARSATGWKYEDMYRLFPRLKERRSTQAGVLSGGEQQMLTLARTLMGNPNLILMDEPSEGMAPVIVETLLNLIAELKQQGIGILLSEQNEDLARQVGDRAYLLQKGQIAPLDSNEDSDHGSGPDPV